MCWIILLYIYYSRYAHYQFHDSANNTWKQVMLNQLTDLKVHTDKTVEATTN